MPMAGSWSFVPNDRYKSTRTLVHMLADVVSKGGNLLLNIGPGPDGRWHEEAYDRLSELGEWMDVNGEAIYETRAIAPYADGKFRLARKRDGTVYAIYLADETETELPSSISVTSVRPTADAKVSLVGVPGTLEWESVRDGFVAYVPREWRRSPPASYAWVFRISRVVEGESRD